MHNRRFIAACALACGIISGCHEEVAAPASLTIAAIISPPGGAVLQCSTIQFTVAVSDGNGSVVVPDSVKWTSSNAAAPISGSGLLTVVQSSSVADTVVTTVFARTSQAQARAIFSLVPNTSGHCP
jgi:hypothetical protein